MPLRTPELVGLAPLGGLALIYWLLAREVLKIRGETTDEAWNEANPIEDWESSF